MPIKSDSDNRRQSDLERSVAVNTLRHLPHPEREHDGRSYKPQRQLNRLSVSEIAYLDYVARVIRKYS